MQVCNPIEHDKNPNPATMTTPSPNDVIGALIHNDLDLLGDRVINTQGDERLEYWKAFEVRRRVDIPKSRTPLTHELLLMLLQQLYAIFPHKDVEYGRIYNRRAMCQLAVSMTVANELQQDANQDFGVDLSGIIMLRPLSQWTEEHWDKIKGNICKIANNLLRKDANASVADKEEDDDDEATDGEGGRSILCYLDNLDGLLRSIKIQRALSPFREWLNNILENEKTGDFVKPNLDEKRLKRFT
jgi:hypothetical protein